MIGIYQDSFIDYLKRKLGDNIKITPKNIICPCPFCEYNQDKDHYHLHISLDIPIFNCFHAGCTGKSGNIRKLLRTLEGHDISDRFIDKDSLKEINEKQKIFLEKKDDKKIIYTPEINPSKFMLKEMYIKKRLKFSRISSSTINGLIYDVNEFIEMNKIPQDQSLFRLRDYLHENFVGFLTNQHSMVMFRNIDHSHSMKFFKLKLQDTHFLDYYRLAGGNKNSKKIVLAEGIFDIFTEHIFDTINIKNEVSIYASALTSKYISMIQSIIFNEQIFQPEVIILSDRGISRSYYSKLKKYNKHIIDKLTVYYNTSGKDFNDTPVTPTKFNI